MKFQQRRGHAFIEPYIAMTLFVLGVLCASHTVGIVYHAVSSYCADAGEPLRSFPQLIAVAISAVAALVAVVLPTLGLVAILEIWPRFSRAVSDFRAYRREHH